MRKNTQTQNAFMTAKTLVHVLKQCGAELTSENVMRQASNIKGFKPELVLPGISINTAPDDYFTFDQVQMSKFDGKSWKSQGEAIKVAGIKAP